MMKYTPSQSNGFLKITVSPDITVKDKEEETKRTEKARKKDNYFYDLVTVEGIIKAKNYKKDSS
jgi:disulfide oxidoreductase YuzD